MWSRHPVYRVAHVILGLWSVKFPWILVFVVLYQLGQYIFDVRMFPFEGRIEPGNSIEHTALKLTEVGLGYLLGLLVLH
jgi:hypothetical protein